MPSKKSRSRKSAVPLPKKSDTCPGCQQDFTSSGLAIHLAQTTQPQCVAIRQAQFHALRPSSPKPIRPLDVDDVDMDAEPVPFDGDFFGDASSYGIPDFEDDRSSSGSRAGTSSSDEDPDSIDDIGLNANWEPPPPQLPPTTDRASSSTGRLDPNPADPHEPTTSSASAHAHAAAEHSARQRETYVVRFPSAMAGAPVPHVPVVPQANTRRSSVATYAAYQAAVDKGSDASQPANPYAPFASRIDWEVAKWAKLRRSGSTAFTDLIAIEEVRRTYPYVVLQSVLTKLSAHGSQVAERLALSYKNSRELNKIIDEQLPSCRPSFQRHEIVVAGEAFEVFFRDVIECIRALFGDPEFAPLLLLAPERHYKDANHSERVYFDMNTGKWWWATQVSCSASHIVCALH